MLAEFQETCRHDHEKHYTSQAKGTVRFANFLCACLQALQRLTEAAEKAKMELSSVAQTSISLPFITATADGPKHIESQISRAKFESICSDLLDRCRTPVEQALKDAKLKLSDLNEVRQLLVLCSPTHFHTHRLVTMNIAWSDGLVTYVSLLGRI